MWKKVNPELNGSVFHKSGTYNKLRGELISLGTKRLEVKMNLEDHFERNSEVCHFQSQNYWHNKELLLKAQDSRCNTLKNGDSGFSLDELESTLSECNLENTMDSLFSDFGDLDNNSALDTVFSTSTPIHKKKLVSGQESVFDLGSVESKPSGHSETLEIDSGIVDMGETIAITNDDVIVKDSSYPASFSGFSSGSDEHNGDFSSNNESNDKHTDSSDHSVKMIPIHSYRDAGFWYWSESDGEGSDRVVLKRGLKIRRNPEDLFFDDQGILKDLQSKSSKGRRKKKKTKLNIPNSSSPEKSAEDDDEDIPRIIDRKKNLKQIWKLIKQKDKKSLLEDRLCTKEEKKLRARLRKKEMRKLRQRFCKKEAFWKNV